MTQRPEAYNYIRVPQPCTVCAVTILRYHRCQRQEKPLSSRFFRRWLAVSLYSSTDDRFHQEYLSKRETPLHSGITKMMYSIQTIPSHIDTIIVVEMSPKHSKYTVRNIAKYHECTYRKGRYQYLSTWTVF